MYNYYCTNESCVIESSRLMEDLLGYMKRRIQYYPETTYHAPKFVIDCGHDTTVAPIQMFMYEAWKDKPEYEVKTKYCGYSCNLYFELYKSKNKDSYYVYYYINDELIHIFDYNEFEKKISSTIRSQEDISNYCKIDNGNKGKDEAHDESFSESLKNHKSLWAALFIFIFTTIFGIIVIIILIFKLKRQSSINDLTLDRDAKGQELFEK